MAIQTRRDLLDRISELEAENEELRSPLDEISDIVGEHEGERDDDQGGRT